VFYIVRKSRENALREQYDARLAERERVVQLLIEQVEYLRHQLGTPTASVTQAAAGPLMTAEDVPVEMQQMWITDDEDELTAMRQAKVISEVEYQEGLAKLRNGVDRNIIE
jgi:Xaa-Pro aminopeptidase